MARSKKARIAEILQVLRDRYGTFHKSPDVGLTRTLLLSALGEGRGEQHAARALEALTRIFVDHNEIRVSSPMELVPVLRQEGITEPLRRARAVKTTIEEIYQKYNCLSVDRLMELDAKGREKGIRRLRGGDAAAAEAGLLYGFDTPIFTLTATVQRVTRRLGLLGDTTTGRVLRRIAPDLSGAELAEALHAYAVVGAEHCTVKDPDCEGCPIMEQCATGPRELERREKARLAAERKRKAEEERQRRLAERKLKRMKAAVTKHLEESARRRREAAGRKSGAGAGRKGGAGKKSSGSGKAAARKKPASSKKPPTRKKPASSKKPPTRKKPASSKKAPTRKKPTSSKKSPTRKKPTSSKKAPTRKKPTSSKKTPTRKKPVGSKQAPTKKKLASSGKAPPRNRPTGGGRAGGRSGRTGGTTRSRSPASRRR